MKRAIEIVGWNEKYGEFSIHTSDQYDLNTTVKDGELVIHFNKIGQLTFTVYPLNSSFKKLMAIETDIVVYEIENGVAKQIFTGIVFNIKSFSNKNLDIGKAVTCISSHIFLKYRPVFQLNKTEKDEYCYSINTGNYEKVIEGAIDSCIYGSHDPRDVNRYFYSFYKNQLDLREQKNYSAVYTKNDTLSKMLSNVIDFFDLELVFEYNFLTFGLKNRHTFYFISKNKKNKKNCPKFSYGELLSEYEDELNFSNFANTIRLFGEEKLNAEMSSVELMKKYGTFRVNRESQINSQSTLNSECERQLTLAQEPQHSFTIDFVDEKNQVKAGEEMEIENKALGEEKLIFIVKKVTFKIDEPYLKKVELKNKKFSHIESMGRSK